MPQMQPQMMPRASPIRSTTEGSKAGDNADPQKCLADCILLNCDSTNYEPCMNKCADMCFPK